MIYFTLFMTSETCEIDLSKVHGLDKCKKTCQGRDPRGERRKSFGFYNLLKKLPFISLSYFSPGKAVHQYGKGIQPRRVF